MTRYVMAVLVAAALACRSTAPYSVTSAVLNTGLAVGAAAHERASGGCYAVCTAGTTCNEKTGYCERVPDLCPRGAPGCEPALLAPLTIDRTLSAPAQGVGPDLGISPATGRAPSPPPGAGPPPAQ